MLEGIPEVVGGDKSTESVMQCVIDPFSPGFVLR